MDKKSVNNMDTKTAIFDIMDIPFDDYLGDYDEDQSFSVFVKVINIPSDYDVDKLVSEEEKPDYLSPFCAYVTDHFSDEYELNWHDDRIYADFVELDMDNVEINEVVDFNDIISYYNSL